MKKVRHRELRWDELDRSLGPRSSAQWRFYLRELRLPEVELLPDRAGARFPDYLPVEGLLAEAVEAPGRDVRECLECHEVDDVGRAEGIFADVRTLEGWVCQQCARKLSAWDFFQRHMSSRM